jgi:hypothetical protein
VPAAASPPAMFAPLPGSPLPCFARGQQGAELALVPESSCCRSPGRHAALLRSQRGSGGCRAPVGVASTAAAAVAVSSARHKQRYGARALGGVVGAATRACRDVGQWSAQRLPGCCWGGAHPVVWRWLGAGCHLEHARRSDAPLGGLRCRLVALLAWQLGPDATHVTRH